MYLNDEAVLKVENLRVGFGEEEKREVVRNISFQIKKGEVLCLVGESGSGKSVTAFSIMQLFHGTTGMILGGKILVNGTNLAELSEKEMQKRRGNEIAMVFQEPMTSLNPVITIGVQMARAMRLHQKLEKQKVREKSIQLLEKVGIKHAEKTLYAYPHEVSGGMRQRIMIAMAMINKPSLLICDEPTSALDVIVQDQIIKLIKSLCVQEEMAVLFITHDMSVVAQIADQIAVMHHGKIVESDEKKKILFCPKNEYTKRLICDAMAMQKEKNEESDILSDKINEQIILKVSDLKKYYKMPGEKLLEKSRKFVALEDISFELRKGETIGIVGESGCGKTTLGQLICGIQTKSDGNIQYAEKAQIIFQDPYSSLNPKMKVEDLIAEPYDAKHRYKKKNTKERQKKIEMCMSQARLDPAYRYCYPKELSGGLRQRVGIARALMADAGLVICDEVVSALDVSIQSQIMKLFLEIKETKGISYVFISHDFHVVRYISDWILVLYNGRMVEYARSDKLFEQPLHPYTRELLRAIPNIRKTNIEESSESKGRKEECKEQDDIKNNIERTTGVKCTMPEGSYIIWVDFEKCGMSEEEVRSRIIDKANVMLSRGIKAAPGKGNYSYRICAGVSRSVLEKAVNRIIEVFQK